jgi:hypothetical protein
MKEHKHGLRQAGNSKLETFSLEKMITKEQNA